MKFKELQNAKITAMKEKNNIENKVLTLAISNIKNLAIERKSLDNITEDLVDEVLSKELKAAAEAINTCPEDRVTLLAEYAMRYKILEKYAPKLITNKEEIKNFFIKLSEENCIPLLKKNKGRFMKIISTEYKNKFEMRAVNEVSGEILQ